MTDNCCGKVEKYTRTIGANGLLREMEFLTDQAFEGLGGDYYNSVIKEFGDVIDRNERIVKSLGADKLPEVYVEFDDGFIPKVEGMKNDNEYRFPEIVSQFGTESRVNTPTTVINEFMYEYSYSPDRFIQQSRNNPEILAQSFEDYISGGSIVSKTRSICELLGIGFGTFKLIYENMDQIPGKMKSFFEMVTSGIDRMVETVKNRLENTVASFNSFLGDVKNTLQGNTIRGIQRDINMAATDIRNMVSKPNMDRVKNYAANTIKKAASAFSEKISDGSIVDYLMHLFCGVTGEIQRTMDAPVNEFTRRVNNAKKTYDNLKLHSDENTKESVAAGRSYADPDSLREKCREMISRYNTSLSGGTGITAGRLMRDLQRDYGITREQAAGIVGNLAYESGDFQMLQEINPLVVGSEGGFGIAQWTGPRRDRMEAFANSNNLGLETYEANYGYLKYELDSTYEGRVMDKIRSASSIDESAEIFSNEFLRPGIPNMGRRISKAYDVFNNAPVIPDGAEFTQGGTMVFNPSMTDHPDPTKWSNVRFNPSVINNSFWETPQTVYMRDYGGGTVNVAELGLPKDIGYYGCKLEPLEMLNEVGKMMGERFGINSAFRHRVYNQHLRNSGAGAAVNSKHISGQALDVDMTGINRNEFVNLCRSIGFGGIGHYASFIHVDLGPKRSWGNG